MYKSYLIIAFRNLRKNPFYFLVNVIGLALGIATCILAFLNYRFEQDFNAFHQDAEQIWKINGMREIKGRKEGVSITPLPLGPALQETTSEVQASCRVVFRHAGIKIEDSFFQERFIFADKNFLDFFNFPLTYGSKENFRKQNQIFLSETAVKKFFAKTDPLGRSLQVVIDGEPYSFQVGGIFQDVPKNSSLHFEVLVTLEDYQSIHHISSQDWEQWVSGTFIKMKPATRGEQVQRAVNQYIGIQQENNPDLKLKEFYLSSLLSMASQEHHLFRSSFHAGLSKEAIWGLTVSAILTLLLACFNFTNTSIALAGKRLKEIALRKVSGGRREQLILQFLIEHFILILIALLLGMCIAELLLPAYNAIFPFISLKLHYSENFVLWVFLLVLLFSTGLLAGAYPAFYLSSLQPVRILKGKSKLGGVNNLMKVLLVFQMGIVVYNLAFSFSFYQNGKYQAALDRGYDLENILVVPLNEAKQFQALQDQIRQHPEVMQVAGAAHHIGRDRPETAILYQGEEFQFRTLKVGANYLNTMGLGVIQGERFPEKYHPPYQKWIWVNEQLVQDLNWQTPVGKRLQLAGKWVVVKGVVKDFHEGSLMVAHKIRPLLIQVSPEEDYQYLALRAKASDLTQLNQELEAAWSKIAPYEPYEGFYQDEVLQSEKNLQAIMFKLNNYFTLIAGSIALLSLYTLVSLTVLKRIKEIGIRKVLGASVGDLVYLLAKDYIQLLLLASLIGSVLCYYQLDWLLDAIYAYRMPLRWYIFLLPISLVIIVAALTVGFKLFKTARLNPVDYLRDE